MIGVLLAAKATVSTLDKVCMTFYFCLLVFNGGWLTTQNGVSPLMSACFHGHLKVVELLIGAGANVKFQNEVN